MAVVTLPEQVVSMSGAAADHLVALGQGDAALLYVSLLRRGGDLPQAAAALGWSQGRLDAAYAALRGAELVGPAPVTGDQASRRIGPPEYVTGDMVTALEGDGVFANLYRQTERLMGSILSQADLKQLYLIYDYLALPAEVILVLLSWCIAQMEQKYGPGRRPRMSQVKREAFRWRERGVDTLAAAEAYLQQQSELSQRERELLPKIGVRGRTPVDQERRYLSAWVDWGFSDEAIVMAYERTLLKKQSMSWSYMNSILKSWHNKGLHTPREISQGDAVRKPAPAPAPAAQPAAASGQRMAQDLADLRKAVKKED